jgi:L-rhamnose mutarotase
MVSIERKKIKMCNYTIYVTHNGMTYQTNVIAKKSQTEAEVYRIAREQVMKQWTN